MRAIIENVDFLLRANKQLFHINESKIKYINVR